MRTPFTPLSHDRDVSEVRFPPKFPNILDTTRVLFATSDLPWLTLLSFCMTLRYQACCFFPPHTPFKDIVCVFRTFCIAALVLVAVRPIHFVQPLLRPSSAHDPRPRLCCVPRCPSVVHLSFQQGLDWFEPHSFLQHLIFMLLYPFLPEHICCMPRWRPSDVFWAGIFHADPSAITHSQDLPTWDSKSWGFHFAEDCTCRPSDSCPRCGFPHLTFPRFSHVICPLSRPNCLHPEARCCTCQFVLDLKVVDLQEQRARLKASSLLHWPIAFVNVLSLGRRQLQSVRSPTLFLAPPPFAELCWYLSPCTPI